MGRVYGAIAPLVLGLVACSQANRPWVDRVSIDAFEGGEVASLSKAQLEQIVVAKLERSRFVLAKADQKIPNGIKPWRVKLATALSEPDLERQTSSLVTILEFRHTGDSESFSLESRAEVKGQANDVEGLQNALRDSIGEAVGRNVRESAALIALEGAADATLLKKLHDDDVAVRDAVLRLLVRRRHKAALPSLLERLQADDVSALRAVIGLLVELKAPESVNPLIEAAQHRGPVFEREVIFAVGSIGGPDAEAYLDLIASGHEDPLIRASAEQALKELRHQNVRRLPEENR